VGILLVLLVIGGGAGLFVTMRSGAARQKVEAERIARAKSAAAAAESTASAAKIDSMRAVVAARVAADSAAGKTTTATTTSTTAAPRPAAGGATASRASSSPPASGGDAAPAVPRVVEKGPFGLDVGTFLAEDRATSELTRLATTTGLKGRVVTRNEDGGDVYHVILGSFPTRGAADKRRSLGRALAREPGAVGPAAP
jgi:hypothetical protein